MKNSAVCDTTVDLAGVKLKNPVMTASGTFGYGAEFMPYGNIARLGGIVRSGHRRKFLSFIIVSIFLCWQEEA